MNRGIRRNFGLTAFLTALLLLFLPSDALASQAGAASQAVNRVNLVFVMDASNSMNYTDSEGLRFQAVEEFMGLMTDTGNYLGGVVFSNHVVEIDGLQLQEVNGRDGKRAVRDCLSSWVAHEITEDVGYTNIGEALSAAVDMINSRGSQDRPSYIVFFSDGNTEMPSKDGLESSLKAKEEAVDAAARQKIPIYSICLNANGRADSSEMSRISDATGGKFQEVMDARDLTAASVDFQRMISVNHPEPWPPSPIPDSGVMEETFQVPALGVEEVNVIIEGKTTNISLTNPNNKKIDGADCLESSTDLRTQLKIIDPPPGDWTMQIEGDPGNQIQITMQYNNNLVVEASVEPDSLTLASGGTMTVSAVLSAGASTPSKAEDCRGYEAEAVIMDAYHNERERILMNVEPDGRFTASRSPSDGSYYVRVHVDTEYGFQKDSQEIGPITVEGPDPIPPIPIIFDPVARKNPVKKTVYLLPFRGGSLTLDLKELAEDPQDDDLHYTVAATGFIEGTDYTVDSDSVLTMTSFSLRRSFFTIRATNCYGHSCDIEVEVRCVHLGYLALAGIALGGLIALAVFILLLRAALKKPFRGSIEVHSHLQGTNGMGKGKELSPGRGRCKLSAFGLDPIGLDYHKCYFQATGEDYILLHTSTPVIENRQDKKEIRIVNRSSVKLYIHANDPDRYLTVMFKSRMKPRRRGAKRPVTKKSKSSAGRA